jgi:hypothetical protein
MLGTNDRVIGSKMDVQEWLFPILVGLTVMLAVIAIGWRRYR